MAIYNIRWSHRGLVIIFTSTHKASAFFVVVNSLRARWLSDSSDSFMPRHSARSAPSFIKSDKVCLSSSEKKASNALCKACRNLHFSRSGHVFEDASKHSTSVDVFSIFRRSSPILIEFAPIPKQTPPDLPLIACR